MAKRALTAEKCVTYAKGKPPLSRSESLRLLKQVSGWQLTGNKKGISKDFRMKDFSAAIGLMRKIAPVANREDHHPDLHLTGYRNLHIELSTHSIGGLSKNDFILAAKIDRLPKKLKKK